MLVGPRLLSHLLGFPVIHVYFSCNSHYCLFFSITILFYFSFFHSYNFLFYNWCYRHWHNMYWDWSNGVVTSGSCMLVFLSSLLFLLYNTCIHGLHVIPFSFIIFPNHWIIIRFLFLNLLTFLSISYSTTYYISLWSCGTEFLNVKSN